MHKVIFLDVDGVLNNFYSRDLSWDYGVHPPGLLGKMFTVDPRCVHLLRHLVETHDLKIVVSSTWRYHPHALQTALTWCGWADPPIIGKTGRDPKGLRGKEIEAWINEHQGLVEDYVIVDDSTEDIHQKDRLVRTKLKVGLTKRHVDRIKHLLSLEEPANA